MLKQIIQDSMLSIRRPTVKTFQSIAQDNWRWALIYWAMGSILSVVLNIISAAIRTPSQEQQGLELAQPYIPKIFVFLNSNLHNPIFILGIGVVSYFMAILVWILLPYGLGRAFGGSKSFGRFAYLCALFIVPITVSVSFLGLIIVGWFENLFTVLALALEVFRYYLIFISLQATMDLSKRKAFLVILTAIIIPILFSCGLFIYFIMNTFPS